MKRLGFVLIMVLAIVSLLVAGCGGGDEEPSPTASASPGATVTETPGEAETPAPTLPSGELGDIMGHAANIDSVKYDVVMTGPGMPSMTTKIWLKQSINKMKTESTVEGETSIQIVDWDAGVMYLYMPSQNMAYRMDLTGAPESPLQGTEAIEDYDYTILGTETYDGKVCLVVEWTSEGVTAKSWIWKDKGFPVKVETTTPQGKSTIEYKNIDFSNIPNSEFELPPGVQIMDMPSY
jgi:outer membrane lipoprotein-sorting protein